MLTCERRRWSELAQGEPPAPRKPKEAAPPAQGVETELCSLGVGAGPWTTPGLPRKDEPLPTQCPGPGEWRVPGSGHLRQTLTKSHPRLDAGRTARKGRPQSWGQSWFVYRSDLSPCWLQPASITSLGRAVSLAGKAPRRRPPPPCPRPPWETPVSAEPGAAVRAH